MSSNIGYIILTVSLLTLGINGYRLVKQQKMMAAVCKKYDLVC